MTASATLAARVPWPGRMTVARPEEEAALDSTRELDRFLAGVERRAFRLAEIVLRDREDALDVVQDAMLQLAEQGILELTNLRQAALAAGGGAVA